MSDRERTKVINDNLFGRIELDELEQKLIGTQEFLRLTKISQLGLASMVFPGSTHTRASHSLGVMHLVGRVCKRLDRSPDETRKLRLAGLLHDVGQYPLSHCIERVYVHLAAQKTADAYKNSDDTSHQDFASLLKTAGDLSGGGDDASDKRQGAFIIRNSDEIRDAFAQFGGDELREEVAKLVEGKAPNALIRAILDSEYDCDRLDYVQRDSLSTGVPYGKVDLDFLIESMSGPPFSGEGSEPVLAIDRRKGISALEHYLLARYFMYSQVYFHKTVRSLELLAKAAFLYLAQKGHVHRDHAAIRSLVGKPEFALFSDHYFYEAINKRDATDADAAEMMQRLLERRPLDMAYELRCIVDDKTHEPYQDVFRALTTEDSFERICTNSGLSAKEIVIDFVPKVALVPFQLGVTFEGLEKIIERTRRNGGTLPDGLDTCWVVDNDQASDDESGQPSLLATDEGSLVRELRNKKLLIIRVYTTSEDENAIRKLADAVRREVGP